MEKLGRKGAAFLGVKYPLLCGGMTWVSDFTLVKAVHDGGGFGVLAAGNMPPEMLEQEIQKCQKHLSSYAVNLITIAPNFQAHKKVVCKHRVPYVIFAGNFPHKHDVTEVKAAGCKTMSFASTLSIADQQVRFGVDALILEGSEAGGHIGHVALSILLQQVLFHETRVPVFVAGGIATGKMFAHLMAMGAAGCQMGTRFVMSDECTAHPAFKQALARARAREAVATPTFDRRLPVVPVRALRNKATDQFSAIQLELIQQLNDGVIPREEAQRKVEEFWVGGLRKAVQEGDIENGSVMAGQSVGLVQQIMPVRAIIEEMMNDAEAELRRVRAVLGDA